MQIKTTMRCHLIAVRMAIIKNQQKSADEDVKKKEPLYTVSGIINYCSHYGK